MKMTKTNWLARRLTSMSRRRFRLLRREHGGAMVELAVAFPIMLLLVVAVADYATVYYTSITVANAVRAGAEKGYPTDGNPDSMSFYTQLDAGTVALDTVTSGRFCKCPDGTSPDCVTGDCGTYGVPMAYDSVRAVKLVSMLIGYVGLPSTVKVAYKAILRPQ